MSAIALFFQLPKSAFQTLREAAAPKKQRFGSAKDNDNYWAYLQQNGREVADYRWSGYVMGSVLDWLQEEHQIDLKKSPHDELSSFLSKARGSTHCVLSVEHRRAYLERLEPSAFSSEHFRRYYNEFHGTDERDIGDSMTDGIGALRQALMSLDDNSIVLLIIG